MYQELIIQILETVLIPLLAVLTGFAVKWLNAKAEQIKVRTANDEFDKYVDMLKETITDCVIATNQTYVDSLKKNGAFTKEAQQIAFEQTYKAVMDILSEDAKEYLQIALGDLDKYVIQLIETNVKVEKAE